MRTGRVVEAPLRGQVLQQLWRRAVHPVVGVRAWHAVLAVLERLTSRHGGTGHGSQRTPARALAAAALVTAFLTPGIALTGSSSPAAADDKTTFTLGILSEVDSFNPFLGVQAEAYEAWA